METASPLAILGLGAALAMGGDLSLGTMLAAVAVGGAFLLPLTELVRSGLQLSLLKAYLGRVQDVLLTDPEQSPGGRAGPATSGCDRVAAHLE